MKGLIYLAINKINGKKYVGQTVQKWPLRKIQHCSNPTGAIGKAIQKYGKNNFEWKILESEIDNQRDLNLLEMFWIVHYNTRVRTCGYNQQKGGDCTGERSEETRQKMKLSQKVRHIREGYKILEEIKTPMVTEEWNMYADRLDPEGLVIPRG